MIKLASHIHEKPKQEWGYKEEKKKKWRTRKHKNTQNIFVVEPLPFFLNFSLQKHCLRKASALSLVITLSAHTKTV